MQTDAAGMTLSGEQVHSTLEDVPDVCPRCHRSVHPKLITLANLAERRLGQAVFRCTHQKCQELFIASYRFNGTKGSGRSSFILESVAPIKAQDATFPNTVAEVSPTFITIFNQAIAAEASGLDQIVGIGLRKALEFLIKDYAVSEHPAKTDQIRSIQLGSCINTYVSDTSVKECAKRAVWLGNDETHYVRKWEAKDVSDLKLLVKLTVNWIDNALLTKRYIAEMGP